MFFYTSTAPREKRYHSKYKKYLYLEPPTNGSKIVRNRITTIIPPPAAPQPEPEPTYEVQPMPEPEPTPEPPIQFLPPPPPPQQYYDHHHYDHPQPQPRPLPPYPVSDAGDEDSIDVIAVDVDPPKARSHKSSSSSSSSSRSSRSSRSSKSSRPTTVSGGSRHHGHSHDREIYVEREKLIPVRVPYPVPVREEKQQPDYETFRYVDAPRRFEPRRRGSGEPDERQIIIEDHRHRRYIRD